MIRPVYTLLLGLLLPAFLFAGWRRCRRARRLGLDLSPCPGSRFGRTPEEWRPGGIWLHAVSVGESRSIFPLLRRLHGRFPHLPLTVTNGSVQGALQVQRFAPVPVQNALAPYDYPFAIRRFLKRVRPQLVIMVETEIWPNLYAACEEAGIPIVLINGRLKQQSFERYRDWGGSLIRDSLQRLALICAQFPEDAERFRTLGAPAARVHICGNLKFDLELPPTLTQTVAQLHQHPGLTARFIWTAGSTHEGEEAQLLAAHRRLRQRFPNALLILAPRHVERFDTVHRLIQNEGFPVSRRSHADAPAPEEAVFLVDTVGELLQWYAVADVTFVGGTLVPFGGHNILEPAAVRRPVLSGPHTRNLQALYDTMARCGGVHFVQDVDTLTDSLIRYAEAPHRCQQDGETAWQCFMRQQGALDRIMARLTPLLPVDEPPSDPSRSSPSAPS